MIGFYGYTMAISYLAVASAVTGMFFAVSSITGDMHIKYAVICLIISGVCDMLDGPVARASKKRTEMQNNYGIQIDSLADLVNFGVLPVIIGYALGLTEPLYIAIMAVYVLAALIRLAYFNVTEMELQNKNQRRTHYTGLPVTNAAVIIPIVYVICLFFGIEGYPVIYAATLVIMALLFLLKIKIPKFRTKYIAAGTLILAVPVFYVLLTY